MVVIWGEGVQRWLLGLKFLNWRVIDRIEKEEEEEQERFVKKWEESKK